MVVSLSVYDHLEAAPDHALRIEGQLLRVHHAGEALVFHRLGVHTVTLGARAVARCACPTSRRPPRTRGTPTLPASRDMRRYAARLRFGTGVTKPSTYAMARRLLLLTAHGLPDGPDRPDFDRADLRGRDARGDLDRLVQIAHLDHVETRETLLGFRERPVRDRHLAVAHPHRRGARNGLQRLRGDAVAALAHFLVEGDAVPVIHRLYRLLFAVHQTQIVHSVFSAMVSVARIDHLDRTLAAISLIVRDRFRCLSL